MSNKNITEEYISTYNTCMTTIQSNIKTNEIAIDVTSDESIPKEILDLISNSTKLLKSTYESYQINHKQIMSDPDTDYNQALMKRFIENSKKIINKFTNKFTTTNLKSSL